MSRYPALNLFIGYDSKEPIAYHVLAHSILTRASVPVAIHPLRQDTLRAAGLYTRDRGPTESTEFSLTRFLVPYLSGYSGYSVFMDSDMLCRVDIAELVPLIDAAMPRHLTSENKALLCCQHDYTPHETTKFLGNVQTAYPRKNWSSVMVFDNLACRHLTPEYVNTASGLDLHRFNWLDDEQIGSLPLQWNHLVGYSASSAPPNLVHWTDGGPWFRGYEGVLYSDEWYAEREAMLGWTRVPQAA